MPLSVAGAVISLNSYTFGPRINLAHGHQSNLMPKSCATLSRRRYWLCVPAHQYTPPLKSVSLAPSNTKCHSKRLAGLGCAVMLGTGSCGVHMIQPFFQHPVLGPVQQQSAEGDHDLPAVTSLGHPKAVGRQRVMRTFKRDWCR